MRVLLCKIHCPFICFCKPSSHIYTAGTLKLEDTPRPRPHSHSHPHPVSISEDAVAGEAEDKDNRTHQKQRVLNNEDEDGDGIGNGNGHSQNQIANANANGLRSSLRKSSPPSESESGHPAQNQKKRVQWLDFIGKELAEIREFESSVAEDAEYEGGNNRGCICSIL